jgi:hypothetical protein
MSSSAQYWYLQLGIWARPIQISADQNEIHWILRVDLFGCETLPLTPREAYVCDSEWKQGTEEKHFGLYV